MLNVRVIPCLDVRDGRVVKGVRFRDLEDQGDPVALATRYEREGADEIVILDVTATADGRLARRRTVSAVRRALAIPLTVGGGVRELADAAELLDAGADRVSVNTAAVERPELLTEIADSLGAQCAVIAIDAAGDANRPSGYEVRTHSGTRSAGLDAAAWASEAVDRGAGEILLTSFDRDGTRAGYDLDLLRAVRDAVPVPIIVSGGASSPGHMAAAISEGADAVLAASIFHQEEWSVGRLKDRLSRLGAPVRR